MNDELISWMSGLAHRLFPIRRSLSGEGIAESLAIMAEVVPPSVCMHFASGSKVFDWVIPPVWHCRSATLTGPDGVVVADFARSSLEVVNYSHPVDATYELEDLLSEGRLYSMPDLPDAIPYVTSYYSDHWGFCLPHRVLEQLPRGRYQAKIDARFDPTGSIPVVQSVLPGRSSREIVLSSYLCHPEMGNNELSGPLVLAALYRALSQETDLLFTYRFILGPETVGSVALLSAMLEHFRRYMYGGFVLTCLGGPEPMLRIKAPANISGPFPEFLQDYVRMTDGWRMTQFSPDEGSDERQYCSPGADLPMGQVARTPYQEYAEYHSSADDLDFMDVTKVADSAERILALLHNLEDLTPHNVTFGAGEPQLGKRGLYPNTNAPGEGLNSSQESAESRWTRLHLEVVAASKGTQCLSSLSSKGFSLAEISESVSLLRAAGLIEPDLDPE